MALGAVALALAAAFLHALWNLLIARAPDTQAATAVASVVGVAAFTLPALLLWDVDSSAWPYVGRERRARARLLRRRSPERWGGAS